MLAYYLLLDLPKLHTISYVCEDNELSLLLSGNINQSVTINGRQSYNNTYIMRSMEYLNITNDWLDLPSLTCINCQGNCKGLHLLIGRVIIESINIIPP